MILLHGFVLGCMMVIRFVFSMMNGVGRLCYSLFSNLFLLDDGQQGFVPENFHLAGM